MIARSLAHFTELPSALMVIALLLAPYNLSNQIAAPISSSTAEAQSRGLVTSAPCPHSCRSMGLDKRRCKDWREGNTCFVEDLNRQPLPAAPAPSYPNPVQPSYPGAVYPPAGGGQAGAAECRQMDNYYMARPRVNLGRAKPSGNVFSDKVRVSGSVEGVCLVEAGLFEDGRRVQSIPVATLRDFRRFEFDFQSRESRNPEIRVYNIRGDYDAVSVSDQ